MVVVDVLRAFTTAAYAFDRGAKEIILVSTVDEAFEIRDRNPGCLLIGELDGLPIDGFDFPNSPSALEGVDLTARRLVQRTTAGTQGAIRAARSDHLFVASLCVASPTAKWIGAIGTDVVTFVETGVKARGGGEEDVACADYISGLLLGAPIDPTEIQTRVRNSRAAARFSGIENAVFPSTDLEHALEIDRFSFAMKVGRENDLPMLRPIP